MPLRLEVGRGGVWNILALARNSKSVVPVRSQSF
jgi:hypothetical protein